jgi:hypothetical protein
LRNKRRYIRERDNVKRKEAVSEKERIGQGTKTRLATNVTTADQMEIDI